MLSLSLKHRMDGLRQFAEHVLQGRSRVYQWTHLSEPVGSAVRNILEQLVGKLRSFVADGAAVHDL